MINRLEVYETRGASAPLLFWRNDMALGDPTLYKGYLGGHMWITHTDKGSLQYMIDNFGIKTMLDVGCGPGGQVRVAKELGLDAEGVDGDVRLIEENTDITIHECDFTQNTFEKEVDLIWSVEFVEHVEEKYQENYMKTFAKAKHVILTFAPPGKAGIHHVNCKPAQYWIETFERYGFAYSEKITRDIRTATTMEREFIRRNGLTFTKK